MITLTARNGATIEVRPLADGDAPLLARFNAELSEASRGCFLPHAYDAETLAAIIARTEQGADRAYIALADGDIAGYFFLWEFEMDVPVLGVGIADVWQNQGLGRRFLEILIGDARCAGRMGIELTTLPDNARAFALYESLGFVHIGDTDNVAGDGRTVRERVMFLALQPDAAPPERNFGPPVQRQFTGGNSRPI